MGVLSRLKARLIPIYLELHREHADLCTKGRGYQEKAARGCRSSACHEARLSRAWNKSKGKL